MKVLLTGHNGYIGSVMSAKLQEAGHDVVGLDTNFFANCNLGVPPQILEIKKDIRDVTMSDLEGFDAIIHLAALSNDPMGEINSSLTYDINLYATLKMAEKAKAAGVDRFIYASSCSVYGAGDGDEVLNEDSPLAPITHYAMSKAFAEEGLARLADKSFSPVFMRNATIHGYSPRMRTDLVLNTMVAHAYATGAITVMGDGMLWRPIVHVEDVCNAFILALEAPREVVHNRAFNVGSMNYRVNEIAEAVSGVSGCKINHANGGKDARSYRVGFEKAAAELGFRTAWNAETSAVQLGLAYRAIDDLFCNKFDDGLYNRLAQLKKLSAEGKIDQQFYWRKNAN
jgi:nucleoside-diphosphate-sugar epimerase